MTTSTSTSTTEAPVTDVAEVDNLRSAKRATAATKRAAAKATKAAAAPAVVPVTAKADKPAAKAGSSKLRWFTVGTKDERNRIEQHAEGADGTKYDITGAGDTWTLEVTKPGGKPEVITTGAHSKAYATAVKANAAKA